MTRAIMQNVIWEPNNPFQKQVLASPAYELFMGGLPYGGKTMLFPIMKLSRVSHPAYMGYSFRRNDEQLDDLIRYAKQFFPHVGGRETANGRKWTFPAGGTHTFSHMANPDDWKIVQGKSITDMDFDELPEFEEMQYGMAKTWCRSPADDLPARVRSAGNPYGPHVTWVKNYFVNRCKPFHLHHIKTPVGVLTRQFIPWGFHSNPHVMGGAITHMDGRKEEIEGSEPNYEAKLSMIPNPTIRRAMTERDVMKAWNIVVGAFFSYSSDKHMIPREEENKWRNMLANMRPRWIRAYDYGGKAPSCMLWLAVMPDNRIIITDEYYVADMPTEDIHIPAIRRMQERLGCDVEITVGDPSIRNSKPSYIRHTQESIRDVWQRHGIYIHLANNDKQAGLQAIHSALYYDDHKEPDLLIFESCENVHKELASAVVDENNIEEMKKDCSDHAIDCVRYGLMHIVTGRFEQQRTRARRGSWGESFQKHVHAEMQKEQKNQVWGVSW